MHPCYDCGSSLRALLYLGSIFVEAVVFPGAVGANYPLLGCQPPLFTKRLDQQILLIDPAASDELVRFRYKLNNENVSSGPLAAKATP